MEDKFVPYEKQQKKKKKEADKKKRGTWGDQNPVTKVIPSKKGYNRKEAKRIPED